MTQSIIEQVAQIAVPVVIASIPIFVGVLVWRYQRRWEMRRDACLQSLDVIDAAASHAPWGLGPDKEPHKQLSSISKARRAYAELSVSCRAKTVDAFLNVFKAEVHGASPDKDPQHGPDMTMTGQAIHDFRVQVRTELGLRGKELARMQHEAAVLARLPGTDDEV